MKSINITNIIIGLHFLCLFGCANDELVKVKEEASPIVILQLPEEFKVDINTRALSDENTVQELFVLLYRNGKAKFQSFANPVVTSNTIALTITDFQVNEGETLYVCCNTGKTSAPVETGADEFFANLKYSNNESQMIMYGSATIGSTAISIPLERTFSKATMTWPAEYTVTDWKVCNVPSVGYVSKDKVGYPSEATFGEIVAPVSNVAYFIPRTNNSTTSDSKTYLLANIANRGWYKLDFYTGTTLLEPAQPVPLLDIQRNTHYQFTVSSVLNDGYATEEEAAANDGSNIVYSLEVISDKGTSNGQYSLLFDRSEITLYPVGKDKDNPLNETVTLEALNVSAVIPNSASRISTYTATVISPSNQIHLLDNGSPVTSLDLNPSQAQLTTGNSSRTITLQFNGANTFDSYLEIKLGNITQQLPIYIMGANCYLADFASSTGNTLYIPVLQANRDGVERISLDDDLETDIVWSDQSGVTTDNLSIQYNKEKKWIEVTNNATFSGNVVIAVLKGEQIKWSWHIWSMGSDVLEWDVINRIYDFKAEHINSYNGLTFMDRHLGAYTLAKDGSLSDLGLLYQFGRKDPFPTINDNISTVPSEPTIYYNGVAYHMNIDHPKWGINFETVNTGNNLEYSIQYPNRYINGTYLTLFDNQVEVDWYTNDAATLNDYLWIDKDGDKAVYNPCPIGWTMPNRGNVGPWIGLHPSHASSITKHGITFTDAGYIPFGPYRLPDSGELGNADTGNRIWWGNHGKLFFVSTIFTSSFIGIGEHTFRADGHYIRCVREK